MKHIFTSIIFIFFISFATGQVIKSIGIKGGLSIANQTWYYKSIDLTLKKNFRKGPYASATLDFFNSNYLNFSTDIGYCQKGFEETKPLYTSNGTLKLYETKFNYLSLDPSLKLKYTTEHFIPYLLLGLRLDYMLSYKSDYNFSSIDSKFHKEIYGLNTGFGIEFKFKTIGIIDEFQYQYDFTKVINTAPSTYNTGLRVNNNSYVFCLGVKYYLVKSK